MNDLILHTTEDGRSEITLRASLGTVWLAQLEVAELFQTSKQNVAKHLKGIFAEQELSQDSVVNQRLTTAADGKNYRVAHYNLDAIRAGTISHAQMEHSTHALYLDFDQRRKADEARAADVQDEAELKAPENTLKRRPKP